MGFHCISCIISWSKTWKHVSIWIWAEHQSFTAFSLPSTTYLSTIIIFKHVMYAHAYIFLLVVQATGLAQDGRWCCCLCRSKPVSLCLRRVKCVRIAFYMLTACIYWPWILCRITLKQCVETGDVAAFVYLDDTIINTIRRDAMVKRLSNSDKVIVHIYGSGYYQEFECLTNEQTYT